MAAVTDGVIRAARAEDLPGMLELYRHLNPEDPPLAPAVAEAAWRALLHSELITVFVAELDALLVSSCTLVIVPNLTRGGRRYGVIENVVTHAGYRQRGLGHRVLRVAMDTAWAADCYKIMLATGSRQEATLRFYEVAGFQRGEKTFFQARRP